ncbi:hypothetical protein Hanom_Chr10g00888381 [Helianthus anomalus]
MTRDTIANVKESHVIILFISFLVLLMSFQCAKNEHTDVSLLAEYSIKDCEKADCVYDDVDNHLCWCGIT